MRSILLALLLAPLWSSALCADLTKWYQVQGGSWTVPSSVVEEIANGIQAVAQRSGTIRGKKVPSLAGYQVQYQGVQPDQKRVEIRGFCTAKDEAKLKSAWYIVFDGGVCYFHALYDAEKKEFSQFSFNGEA